MESIQQVRRRLPTQLMQRIDQIIKKYMGFLPSNTKSGKRLLDTEEDYISRCNGLAQRQIDMIQGHIWQAVLSCADGCQNLFIKDKTGLDIRNDKRCFFAEIKNAGNTDNSSSKLKKWDLLVQSGAYNPTYTLVYAVVGNDIHKGKRKYHLHKTNGQFGIILELHGNETFKYFFTGDDMWKDVILYTQYTYKQYRKTI